MNVESGSRATPANQVAPDELLAGFTNSHLVRWFVAALFLHLIVIAGFSGGAIRDWFDPEGAKARKAAAVAAAQAIAAPPAESVPVADATAAATAAQPGDVKPAAEATEAQTPIEKATTDAAKPEEIPSAPDDLGLSIEDTNPQ